MSIDSYSLFREAVNELFNADRTQLINCISECHVSTWIISSTPKFSEFRNFLTEFFKNDEENVKKCIKKMMLSDPSYCTILTDSINDETEYERIENIFTQFLTIEELQQGFMHKNALFDAFNRCDVENIQKFAQFIKRIVQNNPQIFDKIFDSNSNISITYNDEFLPRFEEFLIEYFDNEEYLVRLFMRKLLFSYNYDQNPFLSAIHYKFDLRKFQNMKKFFIKYKNSFNELQKFFNTYSDLLKMLEMELFGEMEEFLIEIFASNESSIFQCIDYNHGHLLIKKPQNLKKLEVFLNKILENDEEKVKNCIKKIIFKNYGDNFNNLTALACSSDANDMQILINYYKELKISSEELQNLFTSKAFKSSVFQHMTDETYPIFRQFVVDVFQSNLTELRNVYENNFNQCIGNKRFSRFKQDFENLIFAEQP
ncbi:hypothetical protein ACKWTF_015870 [Chironomus riparius]